ncbi:unnamed protein product [Mytilus coruscus]|uniref:Endonuclease/exonuclease/phosphatase domain-containing protein n=1 Tax=Mytilus coruscus TaxID=42192 RepID=A0A6J8AD60_MYTCO|nr:unnamed protein product [Mytilus coruscus]
MNLKISAKNQDITSLEENIKMLKTDTEQKDDEIVSLKMHASSQSENNSFIQAPPTHKPKNPHVLLIGTSNTKNIECEKLSAKSSTNKKIDYKFHETIEVIDSSTEETDLVLLHSLTNELKENTPEYCLEQMLSIINTCNEKWPRAKQVISLATPSLDRYNTKVDLLNAMIKFTFSDSSVVISDNRNLSRRGVPQSKLLSMTDKYHLSQAGTSQLAANFKESICTCLVYDQPSQSPIIKNIEKNGEKSIIDLIQEDVSKYNDLGDILVCGDFNARVGNSQDFILGDEHRDNPAFETDEINNCKPRESFDMQIDSSSVKPCVKTKNRTYKKFPQQFIWDETSSIKFLDVISKPEFIRKIAECVKKDIVNSQESIDAASDKLESIISDAA